MASSAELPEDNDSSMKKIADSIRGKLDLQRNIMSIIDIHETEEKERLTKYGGTGPVLSR